MSGDLAGANAEIGTSRVAGIAWGGLLRFFAGVGFILMLAGCDKEPAEVNEDAGETIYMARCALCHGADLQGKPGVYPPLAGAEFVEGPPSRMTAIILDGLQGPVGDYNGVMPGWRGVLQEAEIAAVMSWLRQGKPPVTPVEVGQVADKTSGRGTFWTAADLKDLK
jgi:mono/diheme cytochrome c family protein